MTVKLSDMQDYRQGRLRLLQDRDAINADLAELDLKAKTAGINVPEMRKWVDAEHKGKSAARRDNVEAAVTYGEMLGHEIRGAPNNRGEVPVVENPSKIDTAADDTTFNTKTGAQHGITVELVK